MRLDPTLPHRPYLIRASSVLTLDHALNSAAGILVEDGVIKRVPLTAEAARSIARREKVQTIERPGQCILPGFSDAHVHLKWLGESMHEPQLSSCTSIQEVRETLIAHVQKASVEPGTLIHGRGWDPDKLNVSDWPCGSDLEHEALSGYPIALLSQDHHAYWVNETFLDQVQQVLSGNENGQVVRDEQGHPTGVFVESAMEPINKHVDKLREQSDTASLLLDGFSALTRHGITCIHDFGHHKQLEAHRDLRSSRETLPDVVFFCFAESWNRARRRYSSPGPIMDGLEFAGLKLFADGTLSSRTAAMLDPYDQPPKETSNRGELTRTFEELLDSANTAASNNFSTAIHAIGDRAVRTSLDVLSEAYADPVSPDYAPRIEHAQFISPPDRRRFHSHEILPSIQPCHFYSDARTASNILETRTDRMFPIRSLHESGSSMLFGSDAPVEPPDPFRNLQVAVHGSPEECQQKIHETILPLEALYCICRNPKSYLNQTINRGMIKEGQPADFVTLSDNPLQFSSAPLTDIKVLETYINGRRVYDS